MPSNSNPIPNHHPNRKTPKSYKNKKAPKGTLDINKGKHHSSTATNSSPNSLAPASAASSVSSAASDFSPIEDITYFATKASKLKRKRSSLRSNFNRMSLSGSGDSGVNSGTAQQEGQNSHTATETSSDPYIYSAPEVYEDSLPDQASSSSSGSSVDRHNGKKRKTDAHGEVSSIEVEIQFPKGLHIAVPVTAQDTFSALRDRLLQAAVAPPPDYPELSAIATYLQDENQYQYTARGPQAFEKCYALTNQDELVMTEYNSNWPSGTRLGVEEKIVETIPAAGEEQDAMQIADSSTEDELPNKEDVCELSIRFELNSQVTGSKDLETKVLEKQFLKSDTLDTVSEHIYEKTGVDSFYLKTKSHLFKDIQKYTSTHIEDLLIDAQMVDDVQVLNLWAVVDPTIDIQTMHFSDNDLEKYAYQEKPSVLYRSKFIPLRPTLNERYYLDLLKSLVTVADYTTEVDAITDARDLTKPSLMKKRMMKQMKFIQGFLTGLAVSVNFKKGCELGRNDESFSVYASFFTKICEIGRRHKIRNPEKMKMEYGKMLYMLQDARSEQLSQQLGFDLVDKIKTVHDTLKKADILQALDDPKIEIATKDIIDEGYSRRTLDNIKRDKYKNIDRIARRFRNRSIGEEDIKTCLYSIVDANCYLNQCARPVDIMVTQLQQYFSPTKESYGKYPEFSCLSIMEGRSGARLTHSHARQYQFVLQSLLLWKTIIGDMYRLWFLAEQDLLDMNRSPYELKNTGQGFQRVQKSPRVYKAMLGILNHVKEQVGRENWIGASRIHVGDNNVPNALAFIDKYNAVPKIISTLICVLDNIKKICKENRALRAYVDSSFGGVERVKVMILQDFFKHAFDGSGAETFDSAGSCVDGRLSSAWNWTAEISSKEYFPLFKLAGFTSFDC